MKVCPDCGQEYDDSDLRTMCDRCMTSLVAKAEGAAAAHIPEVKPPAPAPPKAEALQPKAAEAKPAPAAIRRPEPSGPRAEERKQVLVQAAHQANYRATAWAVLAWVSGFTAAWFAMRAATVGRGAGTAPALILLAATIWFVWEWSRWSWVRRIEVTCPSRVSLGAEMPFSVFLDAAKDLLVDKVVVRLRATETAWVSRGKGGNRHTRQVLALQSLLAERLNLKPDQHVKLDGAVAIPEGAPATFTSEPGSISWAAHLWVALPGFHADVRQKIPVRVAPYRSGGPTRTHWPEKWKPLLDMVDCRAELALETDFDKQGNFTLETGRATHGRLRILPLQDIDATGVIVELDYAVQTGGTVMPQMAHMPETGGMAQAVTAYRQVLPCPGLKKGAEANWEFTLPGVDGPLSFRGARMFVRWALGVAVHKKRGSPLMARLPITVSPGPEP